MQVEHQRIASINLAPAPAAAWQAAIALGGQDNELERLARFGSWWLERATSELLLSALAGTYLGVPPGHHHIDQTCWRHVITDDLPQLQVALARVRAGELVDCQFRLVDPLAGVRWLRLQSMRPDAAGIARGVVLDVTFSRHAAMREQFNFALTQYLIGTDTLDEAVTKIIQLVCEDLGWEWGAYWACDVDGGGAAVLRCRHSWHGNDDCLEPFRRYSESIDMLPEVGRVGRVWRSGQAEWAGDIAADQDLSRAALAHNCGLQSGYSFPVTYVGVDGVLRSPGVLEFFSKLPRQREAQLPDLAPSIGALIALTAQRMQEQERIRRLALLDEMTGLANRNHFHTLLDQACARAGPQSPFGVLYVDLDQFKPINDAFGHQAGNVVLIEFARRLRDLAPAGCAIARLGGDEFAILAAPSGAPHQLAGALDTLAAHVLQAARAPFLYDDHELSVSASIGISLFPVHGASTAELLHAADAAMYVSKRGGRNLSSYYSADGHLQQLRLAEQLTLLSELHQAYARSEFFLEYQPIFDSFDNRVVAAEALIRWRRPNGDIVPPDLFIPVAEQSRLIVQLGRWVTEQVCRDLPLLHGAGLAELKVHINMAAPEFIDGELPGELLGMARKAGVSPRHICLELTEGVVMSHPEKSLPVMHELRRLGFDISLDDFGMGYSSLAMLKRLPVSSFKVDRSFVAGLPHCRDDCAIVRAILELGRNMRIDVIAEGVESDAQLGYLRQFGCQIQGYLLGRPMALPQLIALHGNAVAQ